MFTCIFFNACSESDSLNKSVTNNQISTAKESDTLYDQAVKETQYIADENGNIVERVEGTNNTKYVDYSWVQKESDFFWIELEADYINFHSDIIVVDFIEYCTETSITIQNEGPHCDLTEWRHGYTDWQKMIAHPHEKNVFTFPTEIDFQNLPFPETDMTEVQNAVYNSCGKEWMSRMKKCASPYEYPCSVGLSSYLFRITTNQNENGENDVFYFKVEVPMGC